MSYTFLKTEKVQRFMQVRMERGKANAINLQMVEELRDLFASLEMDKENDGLILTGGKGFFSAGVDVLEVYDYNEKQVRSFWTGLLLLQREMLSFTKPFVAAISGHAPAGGCVLANTADFRIMAEGPYRIGLNETPLGIAVPQSIYRAFAFWVGERTAYQHLLQGTLFSGNEALGIGLIDRLVPEEQLAENARAKMDELQQIIPEVFRLSKANFRRALLQSIPEDPSNDAEPFLKQWWSKESRAALESLVNKLRK